MNLISFAELFQLFLALIVLIVFVRFLFGVDEKLKAYKVQIGLLILMAKKLGATTEEVDEILDKVYPKKKTPNKEN